MSRIKEKANPKIEFKHDSMLQELHEHRLKRYLEGEHKSVHERIRLIKERAAKFRHQTGI